MAGKSKSRSGFSDGEGYSYFDNATRADVGLEPLRVAEPVRFELADPLSPSAFSRDAGVSPRTGESRGVRLSLEHTDSKSSPTPLKPSSERPVIPRRFKYWPDGSGASIPGITFLDRKPLREKQDPPQGLRGKITSLSEGARRRIQRFLDTVRRDAVPYSMCLTCPGRWSPEWNAKAKECFLRLLKQMTSSRDEVIRNTGAFWKQELQSREAVHFHFLLWNIPPDQLKLVQTWIATRWSLYVCQGMHPRDSAKHLEWHLHEKNFFLVKNMSRYFAKYLGKDADSVLSKDPIPGKWWGKINEAHIPVADVVETALTPTEAVICQRIARKIRQKRLDAAKFASIMRQAGLIVNGAPIASTFYMTCNRARRSRYQVPASSLHEIVAYYKLRLGRFKLESYMKNSSVHLSGDSAPETARRILEYARKVDSEIYEGVPF